MFIWPQEFVHDYSYEHLHVSAWCGRTNLIAYMLFEAYRMYVGSHYVREASQRPSLADRSRALVFFSSSILKWEAFMLMTRLSSAVHGIFPHPHEDVSLQPSLDCKLRLCVNQTRARFLFLSNESGQYFNFTGWLPSRTVSPFVSLPLLEAWFITTNFFSYPPNIACLPHSFPHRDHRTKKKKAFQMFFLYLKGFCCY